MPRPYTDLTALTPEQKKLRAAEQRRAWYARSGGWQNEKTKRDPVKVKARQALRQAVRSSKIARGDCEVCGKPEAHGHHDDYSKPLEVRWFCNDCHATEHVRRGDKVGKPKKQPSPEEVAAKEARRAAREASLRKWCWWRYPMDDLFG